MPFPNPSGGISIIFPASVDASSGGQLTPFATDSYDSVTVAASGLSGADIVQLCINVNGVNLQVTDIYGAAINLTAAIAAVALEGGPKYVFVKGITTTPVAITVYPKLK